MKQGMMLLTMLLVIFLSACQFSNESSTVVVESDPVLSAEEPEQFSEKPKDVISEKNNMSSEPAAKALSFSWEKDSGWRVADGSVPFAHRLKDGGVRLYYCNNDRILSAISKDGLTFAKEQGVRVSAGAGFITADVSIFTN